MDEPSTRGGTRCRLLGHDFDFRAEGELMRWSCTRCSAEGAKLYPSSGEAERMARALDVRGNEDLGRRAPLIGLLPLRLWRGWRRRA